MRKRGRFWEFSYVGNDGKRHRASTKTGDRNLAQKILDSVRGKIAEEKWLGKLPGESIKFRQLMEKYLAEHASKLASARDFAGYAKNLNAFFGDCTLTQVTPRLISEYKAKRRKDGVKPATVNRELAALKKSFNLALKEWQWVSENPVMRVSMERENNKRDRWLRDDEEARLLEACPEWLRELVIFALNTGMRLSEILRLMWKDVDLGRKTLTVMKSKNTAKRTIPLNGTVCRMLRIKSLGEPKESEFVFPSKARTMLSKYNVGRAFRKAVKRAKVEDFKFHDLRHTFGTRLVQNGKDIYKVQVLLGHKTAAMTQRYAHHYPESLRDAVEVLDGNNGRPGRIPGALIKKQLPFLGNSLN
jgi:integrase